MRLCHLHDQPASSGYEIWCRLTGVRSILGMILKLVAAHSA